MTRVEASQRLREELNRHGLSDWSVRLNQNADSRYLGLCSHKDKCIILSSHHIDIHPTPDVVNTILHEVAHALTPGHAHDEVWAAKAREIGCDNTLPCSNLGLSPDIIDAIRSGADVEVSFEEHVIRTPKYNITRLQDKCEVCGKVAVTKTEKTVTMPGRRPDMVMVTLECGHMLTRMIPKGTPFEEFQTGGDPNCAHKWNKNACEACGRFRPYNFQIEGMRFLEKGLAVNQGCAVLDEMGLGKTNQAMGVVYFHPEYQPCLWIVKSGLKFQFASAIVTWMGVEHVPQVVETSKDFLIPGLKHYIVGYDMLVQKTRTLKNGTVVTSGFDIAQFDRIGIKCVVLDECQQIKNVDSSRTQMVRRVVRNRKVIPLSGTPWKNRGSELFPMLNMIDPRKFPSEAGFRRNWVDTYWDGNRQKEGGIRRIPQFKEFTKDLLIRRERIEVLPELPLVNRTKLIVNMTIDQEAAYDEAVQNFVEWYQNQAGDITGLDILAQMAKLRHLVAIAKIPATVEYVTDFIENNQRKIVVFAHHIDVQEMLFEELKNIGVPIFQIVGGMDSMKRHDVQTKFNNTEICILVASQLAAGEGLNLQTCADCVMHERQWNPANEEQCEGRFPRPGQTATSIGAVYAHLEGLTAIDSTLHSIVERKRVQFHNTHNKGELIQWSEGDIGKELAEVIVAAYHSKKNRKTA